MGHKLRLARLVLISLLSLLILTGAHPARPALAQFQALEPSVEYVFGSQITFRARLEAEAPIGQTFLFYRVEEQNLTYSEPVVPGETGEVVHQVDLTQQPVRAFSHISYWFEVKLEGDETFASQKSSFYYEDNRFNWQTREQGPFRVHWYDGDAGFAQDILDVAQAGLLHIQELLSLNLAGAIDIYAYATAVEMQAALNQSGQNWVAAGHADPDLGVIVVTLPDGPDQRLLMEQRIPHELMHVMLYQESGPAYGNIPTWLNEGLASSAELYPNPDYLTLLDSAHQKDALLSMGSLCSTFPRDASSALLAYAQAATFTRYLHRQYGASGLQSLLQQYKDGVACERGIEVALGSPLEQIEREWRLELFGENPVWAGLRKLLPWIALLLIVLAAPTSLALIALRRKPRPQAAS